MAKKYNTTQSIIVGYTKKNNIPIFDVAWYRDSDNKLTTKKLSDSNGNTYNPSDVEYMSKFYKNQAVQDSIQSSKLVTTQKPKYFLGAALGVAQLGMSAINMIQQNKMQKEQVAKENELIAEQDVIKMEQRLDTEDVSQRNFGVNTPLHSFYANGGVIPTATDVSVVKGAKHEQGGVPYKSVEVEGGEVIKHEDSNNDFVYTDDRRLPLNDKETYADRAKQLAELKGSMEQMAGAKLLDKDKYIKNLQTSGSKVDASTNKRLSEIKNIEAKSIESNIEKVDLSLDELKQNQIVKGRMLGLYDENNQPINTETRAIGGNVRFNMYTGKNEVLDTITNKWVVTNDTQSENTMLDKNYTFKSPLPKEEISYPSIQKNIENSKIDNVNTSTETTTEVPTNLFAKADNFISSNVGQGVMGLASAGINLASNIATAKNMAKLKTPGYIPIKGIDTQMVDMSATRQSVEDSANEQNTYAEENFANPQVAAVMKSKIEADKLQKLGEVNQQEQTTNIGIRESNTAKRVQLEQTNQAGLQQKQMMDYQKASNDINNQSNIVAGFTSDVNNVITNYRKGVMEDKTMDLYSKSFAGSVDEELRAAMSDNVDLQKVRNMTSDEADKYLKSLGVSGDKFNKWIKYAK